MRVISGKYRGKKLTAPAGSDVRPTSDRVKEALFNIIQFDVVGKRVLDLFAGSGALGIEALSRGAAEVVFVDREPALLKKNLAAVGISPRVVAADALAALTAFQREGARFDMVFLDPPYASNLAWEAMDRIAENGLLPVGGVAVIEAPPEAQFDAPGFTVQTHRKYGAAALTFLRREA